eukprot:171993_1
MSTKESAKNLADEPELKEEITNKSESETDTKAIKKKSPMNKDENKMEQDVSYVKDMVIGFDPDTNLFVMKSSMGKVGVSVDTVSAPPKWKPKLKPLTSTTIKMKQTGNQSAVIADFLGSQILDSANKK